MGYAFLLETNLQAELQAKIDLFLNNLNPNIKPYFIESNSPIQSLMVSGNTRIKSIAQNLIEHGFGVKAILFPTVPKGEERIRISLHVFNTDEEILSLVAVINEVF